MDPMGRSRTVQVSPKGCKVRTAEIFDSGKVTFTQGIFRSFFLREDSMFRFFFGGKFGGRHLKKKHPVVLGEKSRMIFQSETAQKDKQQVLLWYFNPFARFYFNIFNFMVTS